MAQKLSVVIALEGAAEIKEQLADLGKTGADAFKQIKAEADKVGGFEKLDPTEVEEKLKDLGITGVQAIEDIQDAVQQAGKLETIVEGVRQLENSFGALGKIIKPLGGEFRRITATASALYKAVGPIGLAVTGSFVAAGAAAATTTNLTIAFAQSIAKVSAEAIKLGLSFQEFDAARKRLEGLGFSADAISAAFTHVKQTIDRLRLEQVTRDAEAVKQGFDGSNAALKRLKKTALEFTAAGDAAAAALRQMGHKIPGLNEAEIRKYGVELTRLKTIVEQMTGRKIDLEFFITANPEEFLEGIREILRAMPESAERSALAFKYLGDSAAAFIQQLRLAEGSLPPIEANAIRLVMAVNQLQAAWARFGSLTFAPAVTAEINAVTTAIQALQNMLDNFSWSTFSDAAVAAGNALKYFSIQGQVSLGLKWAWDLSGFDSLIAKLAQVGQAWLEYFGIVSKAGGTPLPGGAPIGGPGGGIGSNAAGGLLGGRGTGTSDSNLAWVSRGEFITPARAVAQPGVLAFLEALRRSGGNLSRVLDGMGRFALGGLVPRAIPAFAAGGLNGGSNVTIAFPGVPPISGLRASSSVVDQLHKAAALAQVRSGGRKPSRYS